MKSLQHGETSESLRPKTTKLQCTPPSPAHIPTKVLSELQDMVRNLWKKRSPAEKLKKKEKKTIRMQMEMSGKHDKSIKPHTQMRCLLVVLIYNIHALYLHQSLLCNSMQHASREEEVRTWQTFFLMLYKQGTKNAIVSTQTLAYTYYRLSMHFQ